MKVINEYYADLFNRFTLVQNLRLAEHFSHLYTVTFYCYNYRTNKHFLKVLYIMTNEYLTADVSIDETRLDCLINDTIIDVDTDEEVIDYTVTAIQ